MLHRLAIPVCIALLLGVATHTSAFAQDAAASVDSQQETAHDSSPLSLTEPAPGQPPRPGRVPPERAAVDAPAPIAPAAEVLSAPAAPAPDAPAPDAPAPDAPVKGAGLNSSTWADSQPQLAAGGNSKQALELSIEPGTLPLLPDNAPAWVGSLPDLSDEVHRLFVGGQIADSESEAVDGLDTALVAAVSQYIDDYLLHRPGASRPLARKITADYVWKNLIDDRTGYVARLNTAGQPLFQKWITVSITPEQRAVLLRWDREAVQRERLAPIGLGLMSLLGGVGLFHLLLRRGQARVA